MATVVAALAGFLVVAGLVFYLAVVKVRKLLENTLQQPE